MKLILTFLICTAAWGQPLSVYSDLAEINQAGEVTAPETPREILSPAVVRNGFTSFQVVVQASTDAKWWLFVGQNPENLFKLTMYKESGDVLEPVDLPFQSSGTQVFWLDVWTDGKAPVQRVKLEPELYINDDWVIYPIEARVVEARAPDEGGVAVPITPVEIVRGLVCSGGLDPSGLFDPSRMTVAKMRSRNVLQDMGLAARASKDTLKEMAGCDAKGPREPEWFLPIRDYLYRLR